MKVKLKTIQQLKEEIISDCSRWDEKDSFIYVSYENTAWTIMETTLELFGKVIEVEKISSREPYFTHIGIGKWSNHYFHEIWFQPILEDFLKEEDFKI